MDYVYNIVIPIVIALLASSGFWALLEKRTQKNTQQSELLIGLAHDRIVWLGMSYVKRGWIYHDEYENLVTYLYKPYQKLGGNGSVLRVMEEVNKLPIKYQTIFTEKENNNG
jgi:hypothetical protein